MTDKMSPYEASVLRMLNGEPQPDIIPGAALWVATEWLQDHGYATRGANVTITARGKELLSHIDHFAALWKMADPSSGSGDPDWPGWLARND